MSAAARKRLDAFPLVLLLCLGAALTFTASTVNRAWLERPVINRFWGCYQYWSKNGYFRTGGLQVTMFDPASLQLPDPPGLYAYSRAPTAFLLPLIAAEKLVEAATGAPSAALFQLYAQLVVLAGAFLLGLLVRRVARRHGLGERAAATLGVACALVFQNFRHNLFTAKEISNSTASLTLLIALLYLMERGEEDRRSGAWIAATMFAMTMSDYVVTPAAVAAAVALLSFYGVGPRLSPRAWLARFAAPTAAGWLVFQGQMALGAAAGIKSIGSPLLLRMGLMPDPTRPFTGHGMILTLFRSTWSWPGFAALGAAGLALLLAARRNSPASRDPRDLLHVLTPPLVYLLWAAVFPHMVAYHPYYFDPLLVLSCVLLALAYAPTLAARWYGQEGIFALAALVFGLFYGSMSIVDYAVTGQPFRPQPGFGGPATVPTGTPRASADR